MRTGLIAFLFVIASALAQAQELRLAATEWCPYTCSDSKKPGIISEYIIWLLAKRGIEASIDILPWSRAVSQAHSFQIDGLATFIIGESAMLYHTSSPTMSHQNCFFTRQESTWQYSTIADLKNQRIGAVKGYGYDGSAVDAYIAQAGDNSEQVQIISDHDPYSRLFQMLETNRVDTYLNDPYVIMWQQKSMARDMRLRIAGCVESTPLYLAFNPELKGLDDLLSWLNSEFLKLENIRMRQRIENKYR